MTDLRTAFQELVERDPVPAPPPDLWRRGRQRQRRGRAAGAVGAFAAAVVAVLVLLSVDTSLVSPAPPVPADVPSSRLHIPHRIYLPDPWMGDSQAPPGPLAVLGTADRGSWWGSRMGCFGVSAVDGSYHWVDLPRMARSVVPVLSPDGTRIGYGLRGAPSGTAYSHVVGFAIYDTVSGHLRTWRIPTRHGLQIDAYYQEGWTADSAWFAASFGQWMTRNSSNYQRIVAFPSAGGPARTVQDPGSLADSFGTAGSSSLTWIGGPNLKKVFVADLGLGTRTSFRLARSANGGPWFSPNGARFVLIAQGPAGPNATTNRLFVGGGGIRPDVPASTRLLTARLQPSRVLGWLDDHSFLVDAYVARGNGTYLVTVDADTGEFHRAVHVARSRFWLSPVQIASDLLHHRFVPGTPPPEGLDPRLPAGGAVAAVLLLAAFGAWFWRRSVGT